MEDKNTVQKVEIKKANFWQTDLIKVPAVFLDLEPLCFVFFMLSKWWACPQNVELYPFSLVLLNLGEVLWGSFKKKSLLLWRSKTACSLASLLFLFLSFLLSVVGRQSGWNDNLQLKMLQLMLTQASCFSSKTYLLISCVCCMSLLHKLLWCYSNAYLMTTFKRCVLPFKRNQILWKYLYIEYLSLHLFVLLGLAQVCLKLLMGDVIRILHSIDTPGVLGFLFIT